MDIAARNKIVSWLAFALFVVFPFGQLAKVGIISGLDVIAGALLVIYLSTKNKPTRLHKYFKDFFWIALFSFILSLALFRRPDALLGGFYILRLMAYYAVFVLVWNLQDKVKSVINSSLFIILVFVAAFGWFQYFFYPDLRALYEWGWDDHLYRLVGTFLDPGFTGILLVFGFVLSLGTYLANKSKKFFLLTVFFLISTVFTYSRASYLALAAGAGVLFLLRRNVRLYLLLGLTLLAVLFFLPRGVGEGQKLERLSSVYKRMTNYQETIEIFKHSPLWGVGFNNICLAKQVYLGGTETASHSCSGSDSSLLLILATTGIMGAFSFSDLVYQIIRRIPKNIYGQVFLASLVTLFVHSFFTNSLFYPWVLAYLAVLGGIVYRE